MVEVVQDDLAARTSGGITELPSTVSAAAALITGRTPSDRYKVAPPRDSASISRLFPLPV